MVFYKRTAAYALVFTLLLSIILILLIYRSNETKQENYILKEYNGAVALFKGSRPVNVYDGVVLSALPAGDRERFIDGIAVDNPAEADLIIEDYDG